MSFIPRKDRPRAWGARAAAAAAAQGLGALEQAFATINASFGTPERINADKLTVERAMRRGAWDVDVRLTYGKVALLCPPTVTGALQEVERNYRAEVRHQDNLARLIAPRFNRAHERRLAHARLFLRWYRRFGDPAAFPGIVETMTTPAHYRLQAAE